MSSRAKGKAVDKSSAWAQWIWDDRGFYVTSRYGPSGQVEYEYRYPSTPRDSAPRDQFKPTTNSQTQATGASDINSDAAAAFGSSSVPQVPETDNIKASKDESSKIEPRVALAHFEDSLKAHSDLLPSELQIQIASTLRSLEQLIDNGNPSGKAVDERPNGLLGDKFQIINQPSRFFKKGRVFKVLWVEPAGNIFDSDIPSLVPSSLGEYAFTQIRYFVVIREMPGRNCCLCLRINTYNKQRASKLGAQSKDYAAVYASDGKAQWSPDEGLEKTPFPIIVEDPDETIDPRFRLNFGRVYTVEHNIKVLKVGRIPTEYLADLDNYFIRTLNVSQQDTLQMEPGARSSVVYSSSSSPYPSSMSYSGSVGSALMGASNTSGSEQDAGIDQSRAFKDMVISPVSETPSSYPGLGESYNPQPPSTYIGRAPNSSDREKLDPRYRCISEREQRKFWRVGRVFMMLWTEPAAPVSSARNETHYSTIWLDQGVYSEIRRFVVIKEGFGNSVCSPIHTYNGQATLKPGLADRQQHTIIYTGKECPPEHSYMAPDGTFIKENLSKDPIRVRREQNGAEGDLGPYSRLNYGKIYTVENYVRVLNIGIVERDWIGILNANSYVRASEYPIQQPTPANSSSEGKRGGKEGRRRRR